METNIEDLSRRAGRERLSLGQLVWLYLNPFALFKNVTAGPPRSQQEALRYNRRQRRMLLTYARRWGVIAAACLSSELALAQAAPSDPLLTIPFVGFELGFSLALCVLLLAGSVYFLLGLKD